MSCWFQTVDKYRFLSVLCGGRTITQCPLGIFIDNGELGVSGQNQGWLSKCVNCTTQNTEAIYDKGIVSSWKSPAIDEALVSVSDLLLIQIAQDDLFELRATVKGSHQEKITEAWQTYDTLVKSTQGIKRPSVSQF
jgi:hypothetical protein